MRASLCTLAVTGLTTGCANVHERPVALVAGGFGDQAVLEAERASLALAMPGSQVRSEVSAIEGVEALRCVTTDRTGVETPRCDYRLRYRRPDGRSAMTSRRNQFFQKDGEGRWTSVIIVQGS